MIPFASDNVSSVCPAVLEALVNANSGDVASYGEDHFTTALQNRLSEIFETDLVVFPVITGTAANALALSALAPRFGKIYCNDLAHINTDECGAPELFTGGAKLHPIKGKNLKLTSDALRETVSGVGNVHAAQPSVVSLTQANEAGTVYQIDEIKSLAETARSLGLKVHMDGARFANAVVSLDTSPADMTWRAGVDALSLGGTKNGCLAAEAIIFFNPEDAIDLPYLHKRAGQLLSKMRFISSQLLAYVENDLWFNNARNANHMASRLAQGLSAIQGVNLVYPVESNEIFFQVNEEILAQLAKHNIELNGGELDCTAYRLVASWNTSDQDVDELLKLFRSIPQGASD